MKANIPASVTLILPLATGLLAVRFIKASEFFSNTWLMALAAPVTSMPAAKSKRTDIILLRTYITSFGAIKKLTTVLNTTIKLKVNLIN
jgi:hypothetical protein